MNAGPTSPSLCTRSASGALLVVVVGVIVDLLTATDTALIGGLVALGAAPGAAAGALMVWGWLVGASASRVAAVRERRWVARAVLAFVGASPWIWGGSVLAADLLAGPAISRWEHIGVLRIASLILGLLGPWAILWSGIHLSFPRDPKLGERRLRRTGVLLLLVTVGLAVADRRVLPGLYETFHRGLVCALVTASAAAGWCLAGSWPRALRPVVLVCGLGAATGGAVAIIGGHVPGDDPAVRALVLRRAPVASRLLALSPGSFAATPSDPSSVDPESLLPSPDPVDPALLDRQLPQRRSMNVVLITLDAVRPDHLGCYGYDRATSPRLDAFAKQSTLFVNAYAQYPSSQLSLASLFQGLYPTATDVIERRDTPKLLQPPLPRAPLARLLKDRGWRTAGIFALRPTHARALFPYLEDGFEDYRLSDREKESLDGREVTRLATEILEADDGRPFFLWAHYFDPHDPYRLQKEHPFGGRLVDLYDGEIAHADQQVGQLLDVLRARPDWDRTLIIIHADHGEEFWDHDGTFHGSSVYEEQVRVPLLVRIPGAPPRRVEEPVELVDVLPTLLEIVGEPTESGYSGHSLVRRVLGLDDAARGPPPAAFIQMREPRARSPRLDAVRVDRWKLIHDLDTDLYELYDLEADAPERHDLALTRPEQVRALLPYLAAFRSLAARGKVDAAGSEALEETVRRGSFDARAQALHRLVIRGENQRVARLCAELLDPEQDVRVRVYALRTLNVITDPLALPALERIAKDADPGLRMHGAIALAAHGQDGRVPDALKKLSDDAHPAVQAAAAIGRGLRGDVSVKPILAAIRPQLFGESLVLANLALARLGDPAAEPALTSLLTSPTLHLGLQVWALRVAVAAKRLPHLFATYGALLDGGGYDGQLAPFLLPLGSGFPAQVAAPLLRKKLSRRDAALRKEIRKILGPLAETPWKGYGIQMVVARNRTEPGRAADALVRACRRAALKGMLDWGLAFEAWHLLLRAGRKDDAAKLTSLIHAGELRDHPAFPWLARLESIAALVGQEPKVRLELVHADAALTTADEAWVAVVRVTVEKGGGSLPGGAGRWAPRVIVTARPTRDRRGRTVATARLPVQGLLPGESCDITIPVRLEGLTPGGYDLSIHLRRTPGPRIEQQRLRFHRQKP